MLKRGDRLPMASASEQSLVCQSSTPEPVLQTCVQPWGHMLLRDRLRRKELVMPGGRYQLLLPAGHLGTARTRHQLQALCPYTILWLCSSHLLQCNFQAFN